MAPSVSLTKLPLGDVYTRFRDAIPLAAAPYSRPSARSFSSAARAYLTAAKAIGCDPFEPTSAEVDAVLSPFAGSRADKMRHAARRVRAAIEIKSDPGALGLGATRHLVESLQPGILRTAVDRVLREYCGGTRRAVATSAVGRLLAWSAIAGIDPVEVSAPDLDAFRAWAARTMPSAVREYLVVARDLCEALDHAAEAR